MGIKAINKTGLQRIATRIGLVFAALVMAPVMSVVMFTESANAAKYDCPAARLCFWEHANYTGVRWSYAVNPPGTCNNMPVSMNDKASSYFNRLAQSVTLYYLADCNQGVDTEYVPSGASAAEMPLGDFIWTWNDVVSSVRFN